MEEYLRIRKPSCSDIHAALDRAVIPERILKLLQNRDDEADHAAAKQGRRSKTI
jgi:hypothetical protein